MKRKTSDGIKYAVLALGILFVLLGLWRGESRIVFQKAAAICLECIGIG